MRRTASEVIRELEMRVARLEGGMNRTSSYNPFVGPQKHPANILIHGYVGIKVAGWTLTQTRNPHTQQLEFEWVNSYNEKVAMYFDMAKNHLVFEQEDEFGDTITLARLPMRKVGNDIPGAAKKVLSEL